MMATVANTTLLSETVVRVTFFLPRNNRKEEEAIGEVIRYLKRQCLRRIPVTGFTYSTLEEPVLRGLWWDDDAKQWFPPEPVVLFIIDYAGRVEDRVFRRTMSRLQQIIGGRYVTFGSPQKELWIVGHRGVRYA